MFNFFNSNKEKKSENLKDVLKKQSNFEKEIKEISDRIGKLEDLSAFFIQKVGIVRYNPFSKIGSNQSFSIALLNGNNNGIVITSLYNGDENRVYSKPIKNNKSNYKLSNEEKEAIKIANNLEKENLDKSV